METVYTARNTPDAGLKDNEAQIDMARMRRHRPAALGRAISVPTGRLRS